MNMRALTDEHFKLILGNVIAALSTQPQIRWEVRQNLLDNAERAKRVNDTDLEGFLRGVIRLLDEGLQALNSISADIPAIYHDVWNTLAHHVRTSGRRISDQSLGDMLAPVAAALTDQPEIRPQVRQHILDGVNHFKQIGDPHAEGLLREVVNLLDNGIEALPEIALNIPIIYRDSWEEFVYFLKGGRGPQANFDVLATDIIHALNCQPGDKKLWIAKIQSVRTEAQELGDEQMVMLLDAAVKLILSGNTSIAPAPMLQGEYLACWKRILAGTEPH